MKNIFLKCAISATVLIAFTSCKKGENDPGLSLLSRKARLTGEWTVTKQESSGTSVQKNAAGTIINQGSSTTSYDGTTSIYSSTYTIAGFPPVTNTNENKYTLKFTFKKDGTFKIENTDLDDNDKYESTGFWSFVGKSKSSDIKKKEVIELRYSNSTETEASGEVYTTVIEGKSESEFYRIDRLSNKEIIFVSEDEYTSTDSNGSVSTSTNNSLVTLTKK